MLSLRFKQSRADHNLYLRSNRIVMLLYVNDISMSYTEDATKAAIEVKARLLEKYKSTDLGPARQFPGIDIHCKENGASYGTAITLGQKAFITTIL